MTTSPNGSLMRTPSWNTERPCGVPSSGDAVKPRKSRIGLVRVALCRDEASRCSRCGRGTASGREWSVARSSPARRRSARWRERRATAMPKPGSGVVPTTSTAAARAPRPGCRVLRGTCVRAARPASARQPTTVSARGLHVRQRIATPHGSSPTAMSATFAWSSRVDHGDRVRAAARDVELPAVGRQRHVPRPLADRNRRDDRVASRCRSPARCRRRPTETNTRLPSGCTMTPLSACPALIRAITSCVATSNTLTVSAFSAAT